jgi:uncharacterized delta-60 repeat protein
MGPRAWSRLAVAAAASALVVGSAAAPASADPGALDSTFGGDGQVLTAIAAGGAYGHAVVVQGDGKVVVAGSADRSDGVPDTEWAIVRYRPGGQPDPTFGIHGRALNNLTGGQDEIFGLTLVGGGKLVAVGFAGSNFAAARYLPDGRLDHTFSGDGKAFVHFSEGNAQGRAVAISRGGKIVLGGQVVVGGIAQMAVARLTSSGGLDSTFGGGDGRVTMSLGTGDSSLSSLVTHPDGSIVAMGEATSAGANRSPAVVWFRANGTLDPGMGDAGTLIDDVGADFGPSGMIEVPSQKVLIAGSYRTGTTTFKVALVRLGTDGQPDATFGPNGLVTVGLGGHSNSAGELRQAGTKLLVATSHIESLRRHAGVIRLNPNGSLDTAFGDQGLALSTIRSAFASSLAVAGDARIVVAGYSRPPREEDVKFLVARFLAT